jgi:hypothetical protein
MTKIVHVLLASPGVTCQCFGALALVVGFGLWLGVPAAFLTLGVVLLVAGTLLDLPGSAVPATEELIEEEVTDGSWIGQAA